MTYTILSFRVSDAIFSSFVNSQPNAVVHLFIVKIRHLRYQCQLWPRETRNAPLNAGSAAEDMSCLANITQLTRPARVVKRTICPAQITAQMAAARAAGLKWRERHDSGNNIYACRTALCLVSAAESHGELLVRDREGLGGGYVLPAASRAEQYVPHHGREALHQRWWGHPSRYKRVRNALLITAQFVLVVYGIASAQRGKLVQYIHVYRKHA